MTEAIAREHYKHIVGPHVSEKATLLADKERQFVFKVRSDATKIDIKNAIEKIFKVKVKSVRVCNVKGKSKNFRQMKGKLKNWKKAYVGLEEGFDIDFSGQKA